MSLLNRLLIRNALHPNFWDNPDQSIWTSMSSGTKESIGNNYLSYIRDAYKSDGVVFSSMLARQLVISEARFVWQELGEDGQPGATFSDPSLNLIDRPWANATTGDLLSRMDQNDMLAGNYYGVVVGKGNRQRIRNLRPDWTKIITISDSGDPYDPDARIGGYIYDPSGRGVTPSEPVIYTPDQIIHHYTVPDPDSQWRGMSPLTPILDEIKGDKSATKHKLKFFENGAVPGVVMTYDPSVSAERVVKYAKAFQKTKEGIDHAYKTLHVGGGADPKTIGSNLQQLDFKVTQGASETRIAMALRTHPVIVGLSEGMQGSSLNSGNFSAARRLFSDGTCRPTWRNMAAALESVLTMPDRANRLWYADKHIPFLRDDAKEESATRQSDATTIRTLIDAGYTPASVTKAVTAGDWNLLEHTGLFSVQLQQPGTNNQANATSPAALASMLADGWELTKETP